MSLESQIKPLIGAYVRLVNGADADHIGYASITGCIREPEAEANARLIAAAPALLEACHLAMDCLCSDSDSQRQYKEEIAQIYAAIAAATGKQEVGK